MGPLVLLASLGLRAAHRRLGALVLLAAAALGCSTPRAVPPIRETPESRQARNVILFIGDGMGMPIYTATRLWKVGATGKLAIDTLPHTAICSTYSFDNIVTDSAPSATALLSGVKARNDVVGEGPDAEPGDLRIPASGREGTPAKTIAELAAARGLATGVVTTTTVTHATPAACYAHIRHRDLESDIAAQLLAPTFGNPTIDVVLGGGRQFFLPNETADPEYPALRGARTDGRDLTTELRRRGYAYVWNESEFAALDPASTPRVIGLFEPSHLQFEATREHNRDTDPTLAEMTERAIRILSRDPDGFFLLVEGGQIDRAEHANNVQAAILEASMFDEAVQRALEMTGDDTLILVTADHSHPLTINGAPLLGRNPNGDEDRVATRLNLMGSGGKDLDGKDYPALTFASGPGAIEPRPAIADRPALIKLPYSTHAGEDVLVAARGPGAERVRGFLTNTQVFDIMRAAFGF